MTYRIKLKEFWLKAGIRAIKSMAQALIAALSVTAVFSDIDWKTALSTAILTGLLSVLTSIANGLPEVDEHEKH